MTPERIAALERQESEYQADRAIKERERYIASVRKVVLFEIHEALELLEHYGLQRPNWRSN